MRLSAAARLLVVVTQRILQLQVRVSLRSEPFCYPVPSVGR